MGYEINFAKISNSGKLTDRFLSCQHGRPPELTMASMGELFSLVEILSPWYNSAQIGQMIINSFPEQYYEQGSTSDLVNFENTLKKINENLARATQNGETEWIGNLNGILTAFCGNSLILSATGKVEAYLFRDGKINHLTYGLSDKIEVHPLKTFSNIISGQLKPHDKILITSKNLFNWLPLESCRQIIALNNPTEAASQIARLLRKSKVKNVNLLIIGLFTKDEIANQTIKNMESVYYLDKSSESFLGKIKALWQQVLMPIGKIIASLLMGLSRRVTQKIKHKIQAKPSLKEQPADKFQKEFILADERDDHLLKDEEIKYSPDFYIHYYKERKLPQKNKLKEIFGFALKIIKNFLRWLIIFYRDRSKRKYLYIVAAIMLILIIVLIIGLKGKGGNNIGNLQAQKILDEAIDAQKDAKNALTLGNNEKAKEQLALAITKAQGIRMNALVAKDAEGVLTGSYQELDKLTSTTRFSQLEPIAAITETAQAVFIVSGEAFMITDVDFYKINLLGGKSQKVATLPKNKGNFSSGTSSGNTIYLYTSNQNLFTFEPSANKLEQAESVDNKWETANSLASFSGGLYLLDGVAGKIYKHSSLKASFQKGEEYISSTTGNLKNANSIAIDGTIYVLKNDGTVLKFQRSLRQDFDLKNIPTPWNKITEPKKIYTDSDTPSLYILDTGQKRILAFDKDGYFVRQYALPENFDKIFDFSVSVKSKKIWIINDKGLYEIPI